jgi:hypothetical protein
MSEKKQIIEEMAMTIAKSRNYPCCGSCDSCNARGLFCNAYEIAVVLVDEDYRKQSEGEWKLEHETYGKMRCSVCGKECPTERKPDPYEDYQMTDWYVTSPFCPTCGAKMKSGE